MLDVAVIEGWYGLGIFFYVGGGSLLLGGTGFLHEHLIKSPDIDIWVTVRTYKMYSLYPAAHIGSFITDLPMPIIKAFKHVNR